MNGLQGGFLGLPHIKGEALSTTSSSGTIYTCS